jgi:hypothetical protein
MGQGSSRDRRDHGRTNPIARFARDAAAAPFETELEARSWSRNRSGDRDNENDLTCERPADDRPVAMHSVPRTPLPVEEGPDVSNRSGVQMTFRSTSRRIPFRTRDAVAGERQERHFPPGSKRRK